MLLTMCNYDIRISHFLKAGKITSHLVLVFLLLIFNVQFLAGYNINCTNRQSFPRHKKTRLMCRNFVSSFNIFSSND